MELALATNLNLNLNYEKLRTKYCKTYAILWAFHRLNDAKFGKFQQKRFLTAVFEIHDSFAVGTVAFQRQDFSVAEAVVFHALPNLQRGHG